MSSMGRDADDHARMVRELKKRAEKAAEKAPERAIAWRTSEGFYIRRGGTEIRLTHEQAENSCKGHSRPQEGEMTFLTDNESLDAEVVQPRTSLLRLSS